MQKLLVISCQSSEIILSTTQRPWIGINSDVPKFDLTHWISIDNKSLINEFILLLYPLSALIISILGKLIFVLEMSAAETFESWIFAFVMMISSGFPSESTEICRFMPLIFLFPSIPFSDFDSPERTLWLSMTATDGYFLFPLLIRLF